MKKKLTREERRMKNQYIMSVLTMACFLVLLLIALIFMMVHPSDNNAHIYKKLHIDDGRVLGDDVPAVNRCSMTEDEIEQAENEMIVVALLDRSERIDDCTVTWYCNQTCGKKPGDPSYGITASGLPTAENLTCAVDKRVIPLYSDVFVRFSDGTIQQYWATDTGVRGNHIDIFEPDYNTCIQNGSQSLTVWWCEP